jgi:hypothetical protein
MFTRIPGKAARFIWTHPCEPVATPNRLRLAGVVAGVTLGRDLVDHGEVALVPDLLENTLHDGLVLFQRHATPPWFRPRATLRLAVREVNACLAAVEPSKKGR